MMPVVTMPDGTPVSFPDAMPADQIRGLILQKFPDAAQRAQAQPEATGAPSLGDYAKTNPVLGAPAHTVLRSGQGIEQLIAHGAADLSDLGGHAPSRLADALHGFADRVDTSLANSERNYQQSKQRVVNASTNPRVTNAAINTGEVEGNLVNPAGLAGNTVRGFEAAAPVANATLRGMVSGGAVAATQPVDSPQNFYTEKGKQVATGTAVGGVTAAAAESLGGIKPAAPPSTKDLKTQASEAYKRAEEQGVVIKQDSFQNAVGDIKAAVEKVGIDPALQPKSTAVLARFEKDAAAGPVTLEKADTLRRIALSALDSPDKSDRLRAHIIIDKMDDYIGSLKPSDVTGGVSGDPKLIAALKLPTGDARAATDALTEARDLYSRSAKSATVDRLIERAKNAVGANYTAAGMDTALRQQFRAVANNQNAFGRFSPDEQAAILKIVRGDTLQNTLRWVGKLSPTSGLALGGELYGSLSHPDIAAGIAATGYAARQAAAAMGKGNVTTLSDLVRRGPNALPAPRPAPNAFVGNAPANLTIKALLQPRAQ